MGAAEAAIGLHCVVPHLLGALHVVLPQLWQPYSVFSDFCDGWWGQLPLCSQEVCKLVEELDNLILGVVEERPEVQSAAYQSQGQADRAELAGALSDLPYLLLYVTIGMATGVNFCLMCAVDSVQFGCLRYCKLRNIAVATMDCQESGVLLLQTEKQTKE